MDETLRQIIVWGAGGGLLVLGFLGCVVPMLPGPLLGYGALWVLYLLGPAPSMRQLILGAAAVAAVSVIDYVLPTFFAKRFRCSKSGILGCVLGTIVGLFFLPLGIILGPVIGTMIGELTEGKTLLEAARGGVGAFLGFVSSCLFKLLAVGLFAWWFVQLVAET